MGGMARMSGIAYNPTPVPVKPEPVVKPKRERDSKGHFVKVVK